MHYRIALLAASLPGGPALANVIQVAKAATGPIGSQSSLIDAINAANDNKKTGACPAIRITARRISDGMMQGKRWTPISGKKVDTHIIPCPYHSDQGWVCLPPAESKAKTGCNSTAPENPESTAKQNESGCPPPN